MDRKNTTAAQGFESRVGTSADEMAAFDALPPRLRAIIAASPVKWAAVDIADALASGEYSEADIGLGIIESNREVMGKRNDETR